MAKIKYLLLPGIILFSSAGLLYGQELHVGFHIKGLEKRVLKIGYYEGNKQYLKDTLILDRNGNGIWSNNRQIQQGLYFVILPGSHYFDLLIGEDQKFEISSDTIDLVRKMEIVPICESSLYLSYQKAARQLQIEYEKDERKLKMELPDSLKAIHQDMRLINLRHEQFKDSIIASRPESLTAKILKLTKSPAPLINSVNLSSENLREQYQKAISNFPELIDLSDNRLIYTPYLSSRLESYFNHLIVQKNDSIIPAIKNLMSRARDHNDYFDIFRRWLLENYSQRRFPGSEKTYVFIAENYYLNVIPNKVDSGFLLQLKEKITRTKAIIPGAIPLKLDLPDTGERIVSFMEVKQKDIILFFYDSECGPCKYAKSEIIALLNRLDSRNIGVYAINMNNNHSEWKDFIKSTGPEWIHVNGYTEKQELSDAYMFEFLPALFLIGPDKKIIAGNISFPEAEKILRSKYSFLRKDR